MKIAHVIFDCDGTLVDSEPLSMAIDVALLAENGIHITVEGFYKRFVGCSHDDLIAAIERDHGVNLSHTFRTEKNRRMKMVYETQLKPIAGAAEMLQTVALPKSLCTNSPRARAELALELLGLKSFFAGRITAIEDVVRGKPAPDLYLHAAARAGADPALCVAVEDSLTGARSARDAGMIVVGFTGSVPNAAHHQSELEKLGISHRINRLDELPCLLERLSS